ncbi:T9SS type A sorting domain-containing protein [Ekhidna sp.]
MSHKKQFNNVAKWASSLIFTILFTSQCYAQFFEDIANSDTIDRYGGGAVTAWGDYDMDGDLDLVLSSDARNDLELYINENGGLTYHDIGVSGTNGGTLDWADYDGDGDLDLIVSRSRQLGNFDSQYLRLYQNNAGTFTLVNDGLNNVGLPIRLSHAAVWGDYDQDGDPDLAVIMEDDLDNLRAMIYTNTDGMFTKLDVTLPIAENGSLSWADYDQDNDLDLLITGFDRDAFLCKSSIYNNDGGTFTDINAGLQGVYVSSAKWGDYDNDGDLDIAFSGSTVFEQIEFGTLYDPQSFIYENNGAGIFTDISAPLEGVLFSSTDWGDYDQDGDLDLLITGISDIYIELTSISKIYKNNAGVFEDALIALPGVFYGEASWIDYDMDLDLDILLAGEGELTDIRKLYKNGEDQLFVKDITTSDLLTDLGSSTLAVGDLDGDGDEDIVISGLDELGQDTVIIYKNNGGELEGMISGVPGKTGGSLDLGDYDQDGDLDLLVTGFTDSGPVTDIYQNTDGTFTPTNSGLTVVGQNGDSYGKWGDYDQDGDLDLIVGGLTAEFTKSTTIYTNTNGSFTLLASDIIQANSGAVDWGDYDNDGDLDLAITGGEHFVLLAKIYRNDDGVFVDAVDGLTGLTEQNALEWTDYDLDGDLDLLIGGMDEALVAHTLIYQNNDGIFNEVDAGLEGKTFGSAMWGDHDLDGDMDILAVGESNIESKTMIYSNENGVFSEIVNNIPTIFFGEANWIDIDGDSDLDVLISGNIWEIEPFSTTQLWINTTNPNRPPSDIVLSELSINQSVGENALVGSLSAIDPETEDTHAFLLTENEGDNSLFYLQDQALYINNTIDLATREYMVYISATDNEGKSLKKSFSITLIDDVDPTVSTKNIELSIYAGGTLEIEPADVDNGSYDLGGNPLSLSLDTNSFTCADIGENTIILTATDPAGNESSATAIVVVEACLKNEQTITFNEIADKVFGGAPFDLTVSTSSGLDVELSVVDGPVAISGNTVTITGAGTVTIAANQSGGDDFNPASEVIQTFEIAKADQIITIETIEDKTINDQPFEVSAMINSGLGLTYEIDGPATINGTFITLDGITGIVTVTVNQTGNENFNNTSESISFEVFEEPVLAIDPDLGIRFYPNPTTNFLTFESEEIVEVKLFTSEGREVKSFKLKSGEINISDLPDGLYILHIKSSHAIIKEKLIKGN